jgi:hypothetical protein
VDPILDQAYAQLEEFKNHCKDMREAIIQFDRTISTKADRHNIAEVRKWCTDAFLPVEFKRTYEKESNNLGQGLESLQTYVS